MVDRIKAMAEMAMLPRILEAAKLLDACGVLDEAPNVYVKRYVQKHPEINEALQPSERGVEP